MMIGQNLSVMTKVFTFFPDSDTYVFRESPSSYTLLVMFWFIL